MPRDRLHALVPKGKDGEEIQDIPTPEIAVDIENYDGIDKFFQQAEDVRSQISTIADYVKEVKAKHSEILADPNFDEALKKDLAELMSQIKRRANSVRTNLNLIKQELEDESNRSGPVSLHYRIKMTQCNTLSKQFVDTMNEYNECQVTHRKKCKDRIQRQLAITGSSKSDEELEEMLETGKLQVFTEGIETDTQAIKKSLADIEARHEDIITLENSIRELHEMFLDMAMLVESQGGMIDRIEYNVSQAVNYVGEAKVQTTKALKYQKKARRKKICIIGIIVGVVVIIVAIIVLSTVLSNGGGE